jgi:hypothetical protein
MKCPAQRLLPDLARLRRLGDGVISAKLIIPAALLAVALFVGFAGNASATYQGGCEVGKANLQTYSPSRTKVGYLNNVKVKGTDCVTARSLLAQIRGPFAATGQIPATVGIWICHLTHGSIGDLAGCTANGATVWFTANRYPAPTKADRRSNAETKVMDQCAKAAVRQLESHFEWVYGPDFRGFAEDTCEPTRKGHYKTSALVNWSDGTYSDVAIKVTHVHGRWIVTDYRVYV